AVRDEHLVFVRRRHREVNVVAGATNQLARPVDDPPALTAIVRTPDRTLVLGLNQGVQTVGVARRNRDANLAQWRAWQAGRLDALPGRSGAAGDIDPAAGTAAQLGPWMHLDLPRPGEDRPRILRVHRQTRAAGFLVDEQHLLPMLAAVGRAEDTFLSLRSRQPSGRADEDDVRVGRVDEHAGVAAGFVEAGVRPRASGVDRFVAAVADDVRVPNRPRLTRARPDDVRIGRCDGESADRLNRHPVRNRIPADAAVGRLPD